MKSLLKSLYRKTPLLSLLSGVFVFVSCSAMLLTGYDLSSAGALALGGLPLTAAVLDVVRLLPRSGAKLKQELAAGDSQGGADLQQFLQDRADDLTARETQLTEQSLLLQQWLQFPDAMDWNQRASTDPSLIDHAQSVKADPLAKHDVELKQLIEGKTHELFEDIRNDVYRTEKGGVKVFDYGRIRADLYRLLADVVAIYKPGEQDFLLKTNLEASTRAMGHASLRLMVAAESLPGNVYQYNFQTIYDMVSRAVKAFGYYKTAKPYLDIASSVFYAGRFASGASPITLAAWWAASKATTYGASRLSEHVINEQAIGLIRQLVEIFAVEVAAIYSPQVRYRDAQWIYGVELVHFASQVPLPPEVRLAALGELGKLTLRAEYGRVSLMRQLASGATSRPDQYLPAESLSQQDRVIVAQQLEQFVTTHLLKASVQQVSSEQLHQWFAEVAERLQIAIKKWGHELSDQEQLVAACQTLLAFRLEFFGEDAAAAIKQLDGTKTLSQLSIEERRQWEADGLSEPPFFFAPPPLPPEAQICERWFDDLLAMVPPLPPAATQIGDSQLSADVKLEAGSEFLLRRWLGQDAMLQAAYFLRKDAQQIQARYQEASQQELFQQCQNPADDSKTLPPVLFLQQQLGGVQVAAHYQCSEIQTDDARVTGDGFLTQLGDTLVAYQVSEASDDPAHQVLYLVAIAKRDQVQATKQSGYLRSSCRLRFPSGESVTVVGGAFSSYETFFADLRV